MRKNNIKLDVDSALSLMQEVYNDIVEQKHTATLITKKMLGFMKTSEDMTIIGPVIKDQQKILNDCTEKKLSLVKIQSSLLKQNNITGGKNSDSFDKLILTEEDKELLEKMMKEEENNNKEGKYTI